MRRAILILVASFTLLAVPGTASAATNPSGTGQPNQECESSTPPGFSSGGFANAEEHYAGEGTGSLEHAGSSHAVSQYDVACFQYSQHH
jgi:hypothetical protein